MSNTKPKICFVVTSEMSINAFLLSHLAALSKRYDVTVITNTHNPNFLAVMGIQVNVIQLKMERKISLFADINALFKLVKLIKKNHFISVHSVTPKAGLLAMFAASVNRVPIRIHTFTGQVWANKVGLNRWLLKSIDCFFGRLSTHAMVDSPSQRDFLISEGVLKSEKCIVFGGGSISGVDSNKFKPNKSKRQSLRLGLDLSADTVICLFLGRLNADKGVLDLAKAFIGVQSALENRKTVLLLVGPDEQEMQAQIEALDGFNTTDIRFIDYTKKPQDFMAAADFLCLPSYREGFGSVIIEAGAVGIPSLASRIYGITDAIEENQTGLLHTTGDIADIQQGLMSLIDDNKLRTRLGELALDRAKTTFDAAMVTEAWVNFYLKKIPC